MKPLKVNPAYKALVPRPSAEDYQALEADIVAKGEATEPIVINGEDVILDGHTRYDICTSKGCFYTTRVMTFSDPLEEKLYVLSTNVYRRHLNDFKKAEIARRFERIYAEQAKQRMLGGTLVSNETRGKAMDKAAEKVGLSGTTYHRAKKIIESGDFDLKAKVRSGDMSINAAYRKLVPPKPVKKVESTNEKKLLESVTESGLEVKTPMDAMNLGLMKTITRGSSNLCIDVSKKLLKELDEYREETKLSIDDTVELLLWAGLKKKPPRPRFDVEEFKRPNEKTKTGGEC